MNSITFAAAVKAAFLKEFPNGWFTPSKYSFGTGIHFAGGLQPIENANLGHANDVLRLSFGIFDNITFGSEDEITEKLVIEFDKSSLSILPPNQYYAMGSSKIATRKITATPEKAIEALTKYFTKVRAVVNAERDANNIYQQERIDPKYLA